MAINFIGEPDAEKILSVLVDLWADQHGLQVTCRITDAQKEGAEHE